jgi:N-acetylmuramoyl-L-alanine amidase
MTPIWHPSPNFGPRKEGAVADHVVIHYTAMDGVEGPLKVLCDPACEVSAHYVISAQGAVFHLVSEDQRAWHAGAGLWGEITDMNSRSIGIELCNDGYSPFPEPLMTSLEDLLGGIIARWDIAPGRVIAHSDLAPGRKIDPGTRFDWQRLARQGLALSFQAAGESGDFISTLRAIGYTADVANDVLLDAFRRRFRPWGEGPLCDADKAVAVGVQDAMGLDPSEALA